MCAGNEEMLKGYQLVSIAPTYKAKNLFLGFFNKQNFKKFYCSVISYVCHNYVKDKASNCKTVVQG